MPEDSTNKCTICKWINKLNPNNMTNKKAWIWGAIITILLILPPEATSDGDKAVGLLAIVISIISFGLWLLWILGNDLCTDPNFGKFAKILGRSLEAIVLLLSVGILCFMRNEHI